MKRLPILLAAMALLICGASLRAQPLAERVPDDAMIYVGWSGAEDMGPGYEQSHLKAMMDSSQVRAMIDTVLPAIMQRAADESPVGAGQMQMFSMVARILWKYPTAVYVGRFEYRGTDDDPLPRIAILCQAGKEGEQLVKMFKPMLPESDDAEVPMALENVGGGFVLTIGNFPNRHQARLGLTRGVPGPALAANKQFTGAFGKAMADSVVAAYIDVESIVANVDELLDSYEKDRTAEDRRVPREINQWRIVKKAIGLEGIKRVTVMAGFDGKEWGQRAFIEAPTPRTGLMSLLDMKPLDKDILATIPESATFAGATQLDMARLYAEIRKAVGKIDEEALEAFDNQLAQVKQQMSIDIENDICKALGPAWAWYVDENVGGATILGAVGVNQLRDPKAFDGAMKKVVALLNQLAASEMADEEFKLQILRREVDGLELHYVASPLISPCWTIKGDRLYFGMFPETVIGAVHASGQRRDITNNAKFRALRERLGAGDVCAFNFIDTPELASDSYPVLVALSRLTVGAADMLGVEDTPATVLPPLYKVRRHLAPAAEFMWTDDKGIHYRSVESFPGSVLLAGSPVYAPAIAGMGAGALVPALTEARTAARSVQSMSNLRSITMGLHMYAADNKGKFPADLGSLVKNDYVTMEVFVSPNSPARPPRRAMSAEDKAAWVNEMSAYTFIAPSLEVDKIESPSTYIVAHEKFEFAGRQVAVAFADGHVEQMSVSSAMRMISRQQRGDTPDAPR